MFTGLTVRHHDGMKPHLAPPDEAAWIASRIGRDLGSRYRILRHLASGGMGHVFVVEERQLGTLAAAKVARPDQPSAAASLAREADLLARADHANIVKLIGSGADHLLLEYVDGIELSSWIECAGALPVTQSFMLLQQLAAALDHLHARGIVHSDVKPANVLFEPLRIREPNLRLIDFGVAFLGATHGEHREFTGTVAYMAPEQRSGGACGTAVDIYGLAVLAYEVLTGHLICEYATREEALRAALSGSSGLTQSFWPARLRAVLDTGLEARPEARFPSAGQLVQELQHALREPVSD